MHFLRKLETLISFGFLMMIADRFTVASGSERVLQEIQSDYNNCLERDTKHCYGDTEGCVKRRDCALLATVDFTIKGHVEITASHRCLKEDGKKFLSAIAFTLERDRKVTGGDPTSYISCDTFSPPNYRVYQLWDGERCKLSQVDAKREYFFFNKDSQMKCSLPDNIYGQSFYTSVAVTSVGMTGLTKDSEQEVQQKFLSPLRNAYKYETVDKIFYITEMGKSPYPMHYNNYYYNVASEILHSWFTFVLLASVIIINQF